MAVARKRVLRRRKAAWAKRPLVGGKIWVVTASVACGKSSAMRLLARRGVRVASADVLSAAVLRAKWRRVAQQVLGWRGIGRRGRLSGADYAALKRALREAVFGGEGGAKTPPDGCGFRGRPQRVTGGTGMAETADNAAGGGGRKIASNGHLAARRFGEKTAPKSALYINRLLARARLERLLHFRIKRKMINAIKNGARLLEIPLYYESRNYKHFVNKLVIYASEGAQIARLCKRDGCSEEQARAILAAQQSAASKAARANWLIKNEGDLAALALECEKFRKVNNV